MGITAAEVNTLRKQTGAGMMDCKKALEEASGDFDMAVDILRKKGQKVAAKRGDRDAAEGLVIAKTADDGSRGVVITLNCETDFVAKNEEFGKVATTILNAAIASAPTSLDELKALNFAGSDLNIGDRIIEEIGKIGEKIELSAYEVISGGKVIAYNHPGNRLAAVVGFNKPTEDEVARDVAMQVAAMNPISIDQGSIPEAVVQKELEIGKEQAIEEGKPADLAEKIAQGRLNKFFKESTLINQAYIKDNKKSVGQFLKEVDNELKITEFKRMSLN